MGVLSDQEILWIIGHEDALIEDEPIVFSKTVLNVAAAVTGVIMVAGIIGNALTILAFCKTQRANNVTTVFIVCLCAADLLFCITVLPFNLVRFTGGAGSLREEGLACKLLPFLQYGNVGVSLLFIAMITINRYIMITHYAVYKKIYRTPFIVAMILFCWIFSFGMQIPTLLGKWGTYAYDSRLQSCTIMPDANGRSAKSALFFVGFVIPCLVIIFCYTRIYMVVRRSDTRMRRHAATNTKLSRKGKEQKEVKLKRNEWRITKMVLTIFLSFLVCYLPITIIKIADSKIFYPSYHILTYLLLYMSACINPIIYVIMNKQYRQAYKALLTCHKMPQMLSLQGRNTSLAESKKNLLSDWSIRRSAPNQFWQSVILMGPKHQKYHSGTLNVGQVFDDCTAKYAQSEEYLVPGRPKPQKINEFWMLKTCVFPDPLNDEFSAELNMKKYENGWTYSNQSQEPSNWNGFGNYCGDIEESLDEDGWRPRDCQSFGDYHTSHEVDLQSESIEEEPPDWQGFGDNHSSPETMHDDDECDFNIPLEWVCGCLGNYHTIHLNLDKVYNQGDAENRPREYSSWLGFGNYCGDVEEVQEDGEWKPCECQSFGDYRLSHELDPELEFNEEDPSDWQGFGASCSSLEILHDDDECDSNGPLDWERLDRYYRTQEDRNSVDLHKQGVAKSNNTDILKERSVQCDFISKEVLSRGSRHPSLVSSSGSSDDMKGVGSLLEREKKGAKSDTAIAGAGVLELMNDPAVAQEFPSEDLRAMVHALMFKFQALPRTKPIDADAFLRFCAESMTPSICQEMEKETRNQGESSLWFKLKFGRITASNLYAVANCRTPSGYLTKSIVGLNSWFSGNEATMRGHRLEEQVVELVENKMKMPFKKCGLFLSGAYPILGASPDGINDTHVLEIKSPFSEKSYKEYLDKENKVKKRYLAQIQLQMYMTGRKKGLFCVSAPDFETSRRVEIIPVEFDRDFTEDLVERATKFWKANVFPLLTAIKGGSQGGDAEALNIRPLSC
nr:PREDICTED: uncharacterized protein LOC109032282 [Bemisia tabaci]